MKEQKKGKLLKIYISENHKYKKKPLYHVIAEKAKKEGFAGITVYRGIEGYGMDHKIHNTHIFTLSDDLPVVLEIAGSSEKIERFIEQLDTILQEGLVMVVDDVSMIHYYK